jgi:hypothetical protein
MIYPHAYILKSQQEFIRTVELDHAVNLMHGELVQRLYQNRISWNDIEAQKEFSTDELARAVNYPIDRFFTGRYHFKILKYKPPQPAARTLNLVELTFNFEPKREKEKPLEYKYKLFIIRDLKSVS